MGAAHWEPNGRETRRERDVHSPTHSGSRVGATHQEWDGSHPSRVGWVTPTSSRSRKDWVGSLPVGSHHQKWSTLMESDGSNRLGVE